jgi:hypothetical protein
VLSAEQFSIFPRYVVDHSIDEASKREQYSDDDDVGGYVQASISNNSGITSPNPAFHDMLSGSGWAYMPGLSTPPRENFLEIVADARRNPY